MTFELFYIGRDYFFKSGTVVSSIYGTDKKRWDWGFVERALERGDSISIRAATPEELTWADEQLERLRRYREETGREI